MRIKIILLAIAIGVMSQGMSQGEQPIPAKPDRSVRNTDTISKSATATKLAVFTPWNQVTATRSGQIDRIGGISSRSWTETIGWSPGSQRALSENPHFKNQGLPIFWLGQDPRR